VRAEEARRSVEAARPAEEEAAEPEPEYHRSFRYSLRLMEVVLQEEAEEEERQSFRCCYCR